jgi:hypothetical protein
MKKLILSTLTAVASLTMMLSAHAELNNIQKLGAKQVGVMGAGYAIMQHDTNPEHPYVVWNDIKVMAAITGVDNEKDISDFEIMALHAYTNELKLLGYGPENPLYK